MRPRIITALLLVLAPFAMLCATGPVKVDGFTWVRARGAIDEYRLEANGLQVLLMPDHSVPVVTVMITRQVGLRHEVTDTTHPRFAREIVVRTSGIRN